MDIYEPTKQRFQNIDGSNFGTSFPLLLTCSYPELLSLVVKKNLEVAPQKIFGFQVSELAKSGPRMSWLRTK